MKYLFSDWDKVSSEIEKSDRVFLFLDYDGTLTPIVSTSEKAKFPRKTKDLIKRLQRDPKFTVAIISGRSLKDIKRMVGISGFIYAGNHGLEIAKGQRRILKSIKSSTRSAIKKIMLSLKSQLRHIKGARVEDKGCTLSVHFRLVRPRQRQLVKKIFKRVMRPYVLSKKVKISSGKMVLEVRPGIKWDKGKAVLHILAKEKKAWPVYIGDDVTDQDAFRAIKGKGISIFVGSPKKGTAADYFLKDPREVALFLNKLISA